MKTKEEFIEWCKENKIELEMTNSQSKFLDNLFTIQESMNRVGNVGRIFSLFYSFIKE